MSIHIRSLSPWSHQGPPKWSPERRTAWEGAQSRNRVWEQKLHSVYGVNSALSSASTQPGGSSPSSPSTVRSPRDVSRQSAARETSTSTRTAGSSRSSPSTQPSAHGASRSTPASRCSSRLAGDAVRCRSADGGAPMGEFKSLRDNAAYIAILMQEVREETMDSGLKAVSTDNERELKSSTRSSKMRSAEWRMTALEPLKVQMPCRRVKPSCWLPFSRDHGGRYSKSPGPPHPVAKEELAKLSYVSMQSLDGRAMRVETPDLDRYDRTFGPSFRWKPWVHCSARPP